MEMLEIADPIFQNAVDAIDHGNISHLTDLLETNPDLVSRRLDTGEGYFKNPYLLWFVADNPIRQKKLAANIVDITRLLLKFVHRYAKDSAQDQIDYAFGLVESGSVARECNVQIDLIDLLIENGASASNAHNALANGNIEAARHILERTGKISLAAAVSLEKMDDVKQLLKTAAMEEKQIALMAASFFGKAEMITLLLNSGANVNGYIEKGFHTHGSPLHQAVSSGNLDAVKILVQSGADLKARDKIFDGTPLDWAMYLNKEEKVELMKKKFIEIEDYLRREEKSF